jgi:adenosyl cobinamide kinase/adenosyl cobinamide phosphate guanylyltransferase
MSGAAEVILILGGARSGKSSFAVELAKGREPSGKVCLIATAEPLDPEMRRRIERHRAERPKEWLTIEEPLRIDSALERAGGSSAVIVDCLTIFASNWLLRASDLSDAELQAWRALERFFELAKDRHQCIIFVSNEVGLGLVPENQLGRDFRDLLGRINQLVARQAKTVYFMVAGLPIRLKGCIGQ